ncbi:MAG: fibronectin type III domain-containing protein [Acutalibacteraceae bacterium]
MKRLKKSAAILLVLLTLISAMPQIKENFILFAKAETQHVHCFLETVIIEPTCTEKGMKKFTCTCGESYTSEIPANGHTEKIIEAVAASCTQSGLTQGIACSVCGEILKEQEPVVPIGHSMGDWIVQKEPTCFENGTEIKYCSHCDYFITLDLEATGHTLSQWITDSQPDCVNTGTRHMECVVCKTVIETQTIKANGHDYVNTVTAATCTSDGYITYTCSVCGESYTEITESATGHNEIIDEAVLPTCTKSGLTQGAHCSVCGEIIKEQTVIEKTGHSEVLNPGMEPTCTSSGLSQGTKCSVCGEILTEQKVLQPLGHSMENWHETVQPTCTQSGIQTCCCSRCDYTETKEIPPSGHKESKIEKVEPTCTSSGWTEGIQCSVCGEILVSQQKIESLGHDMNQGKTVQLPTCTQEGTETKFCSRCGYLQTQTISPTGHSPSDWITDKEADCANVGSMYIECLKCKAVIKTQIIPMKEHNFVVEKTQPTCTADGFEVYTCRVCNISYTYLTEKASGHCFGNWEEVQKLTCEESGIYERTCSVCSQKQMKEALPIGHSYSDEWVVLKNPTCTKNGSQAHLCVFCGASADVTPIPKTGHSYKTTTTKATTAKDGKTVTSCTVCSHVSKETTIYKASKISLSKTSFVYNAKVQKPSVTVKDSKGNTISSKYYTVSYSGDLKSVGTHQIKITFKGNYTSGKTLTYNIVPKAPSGMKASQSTTSVTLSWSKSSGAGSYAVYMLNTKTNQYEKKVSVSSNKAVIKKLKAGTAYKFKVIAFDKTGKLKSASSAAFTTATKPDTPSVKVTAGKNKAVLSWKKVSGATGYTVYYSISKNSGFQKAGSTNKTNFTVTKLKSGKTYYIKVIANKKVGSSYVNSAYSAVKSVKIK